MDISEIRKNIINNFLNPGYKNTCVTIPSMIIGTINKNSWFPVEYDDKNSILKKSLKNLYIRLEEKENHYLNMQKVLMMMV